MNFENVDEKQLEKIAVKIASKISSPIIIKLYGELGTGKTTFAKFLIRELVGEKLEVTSPTFNILKEYETKYGTLYHYDFYRINDPEELSNIGFDEHLSSICIIEWPEIAEGFISNDYLEIRFKYAINNLREIVINCSTSLKEKFGKIR